MQCTVDNWMKVFNQKHFWICVLYGNTGCGETKLERFLPKNQYMYSKEIIESFKLVYWQAVKNWASFQKMKLSKQQVNKKQIAPRLFLFPVFTTP